jgi:D-psicose/D-tagatose/L-ribulose 3-epimerase
MQVEENHIGEAILDAGSRLINLHMADSNKRALGDCSLDIDTIIMSLYLIVYNQYGGFVTPEPLGTGEALYPMYGRSNKNELGVINSYKYFIEREDELLK